MFHKHMSSFENNIIFVRSSYMNYHMKVRDDVSNIKVTINKPRKTIKPYHEVYHL